MCGPTVTRRAALLGGAAVAASAALGGTAQAGERAPAFPGKWLLRRRGIRSLGVDTLSIDPGNSTTFETHLILTGADRLRGREPRQPRPHPQARRHHRGRAHPARGRLRRSGPRVRLLVTTRGHAPTGSCARAAGRALGTRAAMCLAM
jgi:hypothetical protein